MSSARLLKIDARWTVRGAAGTDEAVDHRDTGDAHCAASTSRASVVRLDRLNVDLRSAADASGTSARRNPGGTASARAPRSPRTAPDPRPADARNREVANFDSIISELLTFQESTFLPVKSPVVPVTPPRRPTISSTSLSRFCIRYISSAFATPRALGRPGRPRRAPVRVGPMLWLRGKCLLSAEAARGIADSSAGPGRIDRCGRRCSPSWPVHRLRRWDWAGGGTE